MIQEGPQQEPARPASRSRLPVILVALLVLLAGVWIYTAPSRTLGAIRDAAQAGDKERLAELIDFPAVRESLKEEFRALMAHELEKAAKEDPDNPFAAAGAALGMMLATTMVDTFVDAAVSPSGIAKLASGDRPAAPGTEKDSDAETEAEKREDVSVEMGYESLSRYVVKFRNPEDPEEGVTLSLRRDGLSWRLVSVRFSGLES